MKIYNSQDSQQKPSVVMLVYGEGGVGKSTFASTSPKPLLADCENGAKYFGMRGINVDIAQIKEWSDMKEYLNILKEGKYETAVIDPIGELMSKLKRYLVASGDSKLVQKDGSPTMAGWGWLKDRMREYIKAIRDTGLNLIIVAHIQEEQDDNRLVKRPKIETKLADDLVAMVDIVGYMTSVQDDEGKTKRIIIVDPGNDKYTAKDRTGQLGKQIEPDFKNIIDSIQSKKGFAWSKEASKPESKKELEKKPTDAGKDVCSITGVPLSPAEAKYSMKNFGKLLCRAEMKKIIALQEKETEKNGK